MLTDGDVAHEDRLRRLVDGLGGTSSDRAVRLPDGADGPRADRFDRGPRLDASRSPSTPGAGRTTTSDIMVKQVLDRAVHHGPARRPGRGTARGARARPGGGPQRRAPCALTAAGCPMIQVDEGALTAIGDDEAEWQLYAETQRRLTAGLDGPAPEPRPLPRRRPPGRTRDHPRRPVSAATSSTRSAARMRGASCSPSRRRSASSSAPSTPPIRSRDETEVMVWAMAWAGPEERTADRVGIASNGSLRGDRPPSRATQDRAHGRGRPDRLDGTTPGGRRGTRPDSAREQDGAAARAGARGGSGASTSLMARP